MDYKDYYQVLGVDKTASEQDIKAAYRKLARQYHPDVNEALDAEAKFKEINEAYEVLGDAEKRTKYDQLGVDWHRWQQAGGGPSDFDWSRWQMHPMGQRVQVQYGDLGDIFGGNDGPFSDFFRAIFGDMSGRPSQQDIPFVTNVRHLSQDLEQRVEISLTEAYHGTSRLVAKDGRRLTVKIPAGADTGTKVRLRGEGGSAYGSGEKGDLYLKVNISPDPRFERNGTLLTTTVPLDVYTAVLGGEVQIPTLTGQVKLKIPAGTQPSQTFRLRGKGMPKLQSPNDYGDLLARMEVSLPKDLSERQRELFEALREEVG